MSAKNNEENNLAAAPSTDVCWTEKRQEILDWLREFAPPLAEIYETTVVLLFDSDLPARGRMAAHGVREIINNLAGFVGQKAVGQVQYNRLVDDILKSWKKANLPIGVTPPTDGAVPAIEQISIPSVIIDQIAVLMSEHIAGTGRANHNAEAVFIGFSKADDTPSGQLLTIPTAKPPAMPEEP